MQYLEGGAGRIYTVWQYLSFWFFRLRTPSFLQESPFPTTQHGPLYKTTESQQPLSCRYKIRNAAVARKVEPSWQRSRKTVQRSAVSWQMELSWQSSWKTVQRSAVCWHMEPSWQSSWKAVQCSAVSWPMEPSCLKCPEDWKISGNRL
jgi:hypothetical protein